MPNAPAIQPDWNSRLVGWFIRNTQLVLLLFLSLVIGGVLAFASLRTEGFPSPDINVALITDVYRGASATEVESQVLKPIEAAVQGVRGIDQVTSSASSGFGSVAVTFEAGIDFKSALSELRSKVLSAALPADSGPVEVNTPEIGGNDSYYAVTKSGVMPAVLRAAGEAVRTEVEAVSGVKQFALVNDIADQVEVRWRPEDLAARGISLGQLQQALASNNLTVPAGSVNLDTHTVNVVTNASLAGLSQLRDVVVLPPAVGAAAVTVGDVAKVVQVTSIKDSVQSIGIRSGNGLVTQPALIYRLSTKTGVDILATDSKVRDALAKLAGSDSLDGAQVVTVVSAATAVSKQVSEIREGAIGGPIGTGPAANLGYALGGIWLVILVMLVFVNWRAALISALVIPLSLFFTFISLKAMGVSLNTLTLFSMILVLGLVVDPAIVVLEAIQRELDLGKRGTEAVMTAVGSIGNGVFMSVLTSIIVFVPFAVVSGVFGQIIRYIPLTVIPALVASYFVPLLFLTYLAQRFLRPARKAARNEEESLWKSGRWFIRTNRKILSWPWYGKLALMVLIFGSSFAVAGGLFVTKKVIPVQFSSTPDSSQLQLSVSFPANLTVTGKQSLLARIDPVLADEPAVDTYFPLDQSAGTVNFIVNLVARSQRDANSPLIVDRLNARFAQISRADQHEYFGVHSLSLGPPVNEYPVAVNIYGNDLASLRKAAVATGDVLRARPEVTRVEDGFTGVDNPEIQVILDRPKLQSLGLSSVQVAQELSGLIGTSPVTKFTASLDGVDRTDEVLLTQAIRPDSLQAISELVLLSTPASTVRVRDIATVAQDQAFSGISRLNGSRYVTVRAKVRDELKDAAAPQKAVSEYWNSDRLLAAGLRPDALEDKGSGNEFVQSFKDLFLALGAALLLTYIVLVLFFRSFTQPFIILFSIPLAFLGVFPALASVGGQFGFLEILGIITLVGIVENVGIFVIDLANRKRAEGVEYREAIAEATGVRFRPIFLTKVTALGGLLPLIILSPFWRSLALVVVSGILTSGVLSLFTTPVLYGWLVELGGWLDRLVHGKSRNE